MPYTIDHPSTSVSSGTIVFMSIVIQSHQIIHSELIPIYLSQHNAISLLFNNALSYHPSLYSIQPIPVLVIPFYDISTSIPHILMILLITTICIGIFLIMIIVFIHQIPIIYSTTLNSISRSPKLIMQYYSHTPEFVYFSIMPQYTLVLNWNTFSSIPQLF